MPFVNKHQFKWKNQPIKRKQTTEIILHCSATPEGKDFTVDDIHKWHLARNFAGIGYNFVIYRDGTVHEGRPEAYVGAHCTNHNSNAIGICYIGGVEKNGKTPKDTRTPEQKKAMVLLVDELLKKYNLTNKAVHCHYEYANKACPSFKREDFLKELEDIQNLPF